MMLAMELTWRPVISPTAAALLGAALGLLALVAYARTFRESPARSLALLMMRWAAVAAVVLLLMGPSVVAPTAADPGRGRLTVLLDTSGSMLTEDAAGETRLRYVIDRWLSPEKLASLQRHFDVRLMGFDASARALAADVLAQPAEQIATGRATRYADTLRDLLLQSPDRDQAVLVLGDGHDTDEKPLRPVIALAREQGVSFHTVAVGASTVPRDLALVAVPRQEYLLAGEGGQIAATVYQVGADDAAVALHAKGEGMDERRTLRFAGRASATVELPVKHDQPGIYEYTITVNAVEGEAVTTNNSQTVFVEVTARRIRVLLLEGEPFWDTKFIAQALRTDPRVELASITQVSQRKRSDIVTRSERGTIAVPQTPEQFADYDVVLLGRGLEKLMPPETAAVLAKYVASGTGHVVFTRGRAYDPDTPAGREMRQRLAPLEPVVWGGGAEPVPDRSRLELTPEGRSHPSFTFAGLGASGGEVLEALPPLLSMEPVQSLKPAAKTLAVLGPISQAADGAEPSTARPAIVTMNYGGGRVFAVAGEGLWRWSLLPPRLSQYRGAFEAFWSNTIRWIAMGGEFQPGQDIAMKLSRTSLRLGDPIDLDVTLKFSPPASYAPTLRVSGPDGQSQALPLKPIPGVDTRLTASFTPQQAGAWTAVLDAPPLSPARQVRRFSVYDLNVERLRTGARPEVMRDLAEQTGGQAYTADQEIDLADRLRRDRVAKVAPPQARYTWDRAWVMAVLLCWMGLEWIGRRQSGWL